MVEITVFYDTLVSAVSACAKLFTAEKSLVCVRHPGNSTAMDRIANLLVSIRNAQAVQHERVRLPYSSMTERVAHVLKQHGFVSSVSSEGEGVAKLLVMGLEGSRKIQQSRRVSKPGRRMYVGTDEIPSIRSGHGLVILSTPQGVLSGKEARKAKVGGELLCQLF